MTSISCIAATDNTVDTICEQCDQTETPGIAWRELVVRNAPLAYLFRSTWVPTIFYQRVLHSVFYVHLEKPYRNHILTGDRYRHILYGSFEINSSSLCGRCNFESVVFDLALADLRFHCTFLLFLRTEPAYATRHGVWRMYSITSNPSDSSSLRVPRPEWSLANTVFC